MHELSLLAAMLCLLALAPLAALGFVIHQNQKILSTLKREGDLQMASWNDLKTTVASKDSIDESFKTFAAGLVAKLEEFKDEPSPDDVQAMIDDINKHGQDFADAMKQNTEASDEPSTAPQSADEDDDTSSS